MLRARTQTPPSNTRAKVPNTLDADARSSAARAPRAATGTDTGASACGSLKNASARGLP